ncbi:MAG: nuclear transport factor 2 family protein [Saprospiraceae bacterium]|nr:nuclear transport factor 2 family protein [Saprospiraceae bacterium]
MNSRLFYHEKIKQRNLAKQAAIYEVMAKYYQGVEEAQLDLLQDVFHKTWAMRDNDVPKRDRINVEDKPTFIQRVRNHGPYKNYAADRVLADLKVLAEGWAFVQIIKTTSGNSTLFFLVETKTGWLILDKIWINTEGEPAEDLDTVAEYKVLENLLHTYQDAIKSTHDQYLGQLLDPEWNAKFWDAQGSLVLESRPDFFINLPQADLELSEIKSINLFQSKLAILQASRQKEEGTVFFVLFNIEGTWKIACERRILHA